MSCSVSQLFFCLCVCVAFALALTVGRLTHFLCVCVVSLTVGRLTHWLFFRLSAKRRAGHSVIPPVRTSVVLGSGGHTAELTPVLKSLDLTQFHLTLYKADSDERSEASVKHELGVGLLKSALELKFVSIPRSREVKQSWITTVFTSIKALITCLSFTFQNFPDLVIVNGPGTCVPLVAACLIWELLCFRSLKLVYLESVCRVTSLSLTGKLIYNLADRFVVMWPELKEKYPEALYLGVII
eukprot:GHVN01005338.1.p1 GENE.GHVN01005338.1~~GHVN01005338.1.p1  ORF type:complete len:241 (+),score=44.96 GHVN01005338.1:102-824(+)